MADKDPSSKAKATSPQASNATLRQFSWSYWLILTTIVATLAFYFIRRFEQIKAVSITPTSVLDTRSFGFTPTEAYESLRALGPKGREIYKEVNRVDFILSPIVLRQFFLNTFPATSARSDQVRDLLANMYFLGDLLENASVSIMLKTYPKILDYFAWAGCVGNIVKNLGIILALLSIVYEIYVWFRGSKMKTH
jgi:hypothetical protein